MAELSPPLDADQRIATAVNSDVPRIYFNGFVNNLSTGDVMVVLERAGKPVGILNMSYTVAKSLAASIGQLVAVLESSTGQTMLTTGDDVEKALLKLQKPTVKN